jgi:hypothetical protein
LSAPSFTSFGRASFDRFSWWGLNDLRLGLLLIFNTVQIVNFAQGQLLMLGPSLASAVNSAGPLRIELLKPASAGAAQSHRLTMADMISLWCSRVEITSDIGPCRN